MGDDAQLYDDAFEALHAIQTEYPGEPIAFLAGRMADDIKANAPPREMIPGRIYAMLDERTFVTEAEKVASRKAKPADPKYRTPTFKCLEDFEKCKRHSSSINLCRAALAICVGKQLIPFTK
jgi:hypothetical protein